MADWWERRRCFEAQIRILEEAGFAVEAPDPLPEVGVTTIRVTTQIEGEECRLEVQFPELYPFFRFHVIAPDLDLPLHQNPFDKGLCLLDARTPFRARGDSVKVFIEERLPETIRLAKSSDPGEAEGLEARQAEPFTDYYPYLNEGVILVDGSWRLPGEDGGDIVLGTASPNGPSKRLAVLEVRGSKGDVIATASEQIQGLFPRRLAGKWVRLPELPRTQDWEEVYTQARMNRPGFSGDQFT